MYIEEFLYRGKPEGSLDEPAWHITVAEELTDSNGRKVISRSAMNMSQAIAKGFNLPAIIAEINNVAISQILERSTEIDALKAEIEELKK